MLSALSFLTLLPALLTGCAQEEELLIGEAPSMPDAKLEGEPKVYSGNPPNQTFHDAVVGIHERTRRGVYTLPFCSGTLIGDNWVLTAAHCAVDSRGRAKSASTFAIYVGDDPSADLASHIYYVSNVYVHSSYNRSTLQNDIALLKLSSAVTEVAEVPYLPSTLALTSADIGANLNHAGFGYDETRAYGVKLQVDVPLGGLGCTVAGCSSAGNASTQFSYSQVGGTSNLGIGPCNGDSGGPAFITRSGVTYVAGITSYGDANCNIYGVSTKVDGFASWIRGYTGF